MTPTPRKRKSASLWVWLGLTSAFACSSSGPPEQDVDRHLASPKAPASSSPSKTALTPEVEREDVDALWRALSEEASRRPFDGGTAETARRTLADRVAKLVRERRPDFPAMSLSIYAGERLGTALEPRPTISVNLSATGCKAHEELARLSKSADAGQTWLGIGHRRNTDPPLSSDERVGFRPIIAVNHKACCVPGICGDHGLCTSTGCACEPGWGDPVCTTPRPLRDGEVADAIVEVVGAAAESACVQALVRAWLPGPDGEPVAVEDTIQVSGLSAEPGMSWRIQLGDRSGGCEYSALKAEPLGGLRADLWSEAPLDDAVRSAARRRPHQPTPEELAGVEVDDPPAHEIRTSAE